MRNTLQNKTNTDISPNDRCGKGHSPNEVAIENIKNLDYFIQKLPAVPSHYCRASSLKKYLPAEFGNISRLYLVYMDFYKKSNH